jgi:anaerobic selenocysteine-containing dehydrogenase
MPDVLLDVGRRLARPLNPALPFQTFDEMLMASFKSLPPIPPSASPDDTWDTAQQQGGWWDTQATRAPRQGRQETAPKTSPLRYAEPQFDGDAGEFPFSFLPYASQAFLDGSLAHLPWLQELPDVISTAMWSQWVEINPRTAARFGIAQGDVVEVASRHGRVRAPALVSPGLAPEMIAMPIGQGHETFTRYASGRGQNPLHLLSPLTEPATGALAWAATRVRISRIGGPEDDDLILFAGETRERPHEPR